MALSEVSFQPESAEGPTKAATFLAAFASEVFFFSLPIAFQKAELENELR